MQLHAQRLLARSVQRGVREKANPQEVEQLLTLRRANQVGRCYICGVGEAEVVERVRVVELSPKKGVYHHASYLTPLNFAWCCHECNKRKCEVRVSFNSLTTKVVDIPAYIDANLHNLRLLYTQLINNRITSATRPMYNACIRLHLCRGCKRLLPITRFKLIRVMEVGAHCKRCSGLGITTSDLGAWQVGELLGDVMMLALQHAGLREPHSNDFGVNID